MTSDRTPRHISEKRTLLSTGFFTVYSVTADFGDFQREYFVTEDGPRVGILAFKDDSILMVRQYRFLLNGLSWEIPGGKVDPGEDLETAAGREFLEETGYRCANLKSLFSYDVGLDIRHNPTSLFETSEVEYVHPIEEETVDVEWVPFDDCLEWVLTGKITDIFTITAVFSHQLLIRDGRTFTGRT